jgi:hypothetical protein
MDISDVARELIALHRSVQRDGGYDDADTVGDSTCPLKDLKGFDSMLVPQLIRRLAKKLGCPLQKGVRVRNIYVDGRRKLSISEIATGFRDKYMKQAKEVAQV